MNDNRIDFLKYFPFFENLEMVDLEKIAPLFMERSYEKGANVFLEGDEGDELFIIHSGIVKICKGEHDREIILAVFRDGDFFGEMAVMENEQTRSASAKTMEKTKLYVLRKCDFSRLMNDNPHITLKILETAMERLRKANQLISDLTMADIRTRIVRVMLRLAEDHGIRRKDGILIDLKLTHQQLADMTGTVRETVTRIMLELQNQRYINVNKKKILISNVEGFEELAANQNT